MFQIESYHIFPFLLLVTIDDVSDNVSFILQRKYDKNHITVVMVGETQVKVLWLNNLLDKPK